MQTDITYAVLIYDERARVWEEAGRYEDYGYAQYIENLYKEKHYSTDVKEIYKGIA